MDPIINSYEIQSTVYISGINITSVGIGYQIDMGNLIAYDESYFDRYAGYCGTKTSIALNQFRKELVEEFCDGPILDVGIGSGEFIETMTASGVASYGFDINPKGLQWLTCRGLLRDPTKINESNTVIGLTFWDSLEHIPNPSLIWKCLDNQFVFLSLPIIKDLKNLLTWKHFKPNEHLYYFTRSGLIQYMQDSGFEHLTTRVGEQECGREDIESFAFRKRNFNS